MPTYTNIAKPTDSTYTKVSKPSGAGSGTIKAGMTTGLMVPLTYSTDHTISMSGYVNIAKPTSTLWTDVIKPTS